MGCASVLCLAELDVLQLLTLSSRQKRRVNAPIEALSSQSESHRVFWTDRSASSLIVRFQDRVEQVHVFFRKCRDHLLMVLQTMFPLNPAPRSLVELMKKFKTPAKVRGLVREQLVSGAEVSFAFVQAEY